MTRVNSVQRVLVSAACVAGGMFGVRDAEACGGFFCQAVPIDQAGEQIIFRQDGDMVTAVVLIQYVGDASDFSWIVPVPGIPEFSTGSDLIFAPLEFATRPQFVLETTGETCPQPRNDLGFIGLGGSAPTATDGEDAADAVEIVQELSVGPFDVLVLSSDDAEALAKWLEENDYDLSDRGEELIAPYVEEGMNFVALRLQQDKGVGDLQPLIMRYQSERPMIPIRLTAVAAKLDMGVIVWLLGDSRAVPLNYLHVTPNYTRLNWYLGTTSAYASYQGLITAAMDEAGGQGFATDYAGRDPALVSRLPQVEPLDAELDRISSFGDADFVAALASGFVFPQSKILEILRRNLLLPAVNDDFIYQVPALLEDVFTPEELSAGRAGILAELINDVLGPLAETLAVFDGDPFLTRLYTTLSPEEMTLDPIFDFNPDLEDQPLERRAKMDVECTSRGTHWSLTLGSGTGRDGELVIEGNGLPPGFTPPVILQDAVWRSETVAATGPPTVVTQKQFVVAQINGDDDADGVANDIDNCVGIPNPGQADCDMNGTGDICEIANCGGDPACDDCNANGVPDECDIAGGSNDANGDGVPDECELSAPPAVDPGLCGSGTGLCGTGILGTLAVIMLGMRLMRSRRRLV
ncbi:MAG: DUF2330 domain-containing protein [Planctomycetes bacterium]|nr:DUF2330 domain-containing protein [Planctomycetota bacterium]